MGKIAICYEKAKMVRVEFDDTPELRKSLEKGVLPEDVEDALCDELDGLGNWEYDWRADDVDSGKTIMDWSR